MSLPTGIITAWFGAIVDIPAGWFLCDGNNGTPNLRNRFIVGAGDTYAVNDTGGNILHNHTFTGDGHAHLLDSGTGIAAGANFNATSSVNPAIGTTDNENGLPPYYALAFIMKS